MISPLIPDIPVGVYYLANESAKAILTTCVVLPLYGFYTLSHNTYQILESGAKSVYTGGSKGFLSFSGNQASESATPTLINGSPKITP